MLTYPVNLDGLNFGPSIHLYPYSVFACIEGSGESWYLR